MATDETRRYRDLIAFGLLAVAALYFVGALSLLFSSGDGLFGSGLGFADKAALNGYLFTAVIPILSLVVAALLVTRYGEPSGSARVVVLAALGIAALDLLFALITFFAQLGSSQGVGFQGTSGGKFVGVVLGLAHLLLLGLAGLYLVTALRSLPTPAGAAQRPWGTQPGQPPYGQPGQPAWGQPGQQPWGQPQWSYGSAPASQGQQGAWGQPGAAGQAPPAVPGGWGGASGGWHDPAAAQQGQPASAWTQPGQDWAQPAGSAGEWDERGQSAWGQSAGASEWTPEPETPSEPQTHTEAESAAGESSPVEAAPADGPTAEPQGWWRRPEK